MTQFFRSGIYEYDKVKKTPALKCVRCGGDIVKRRGPTPKYCPTCSDGRKKELDAAYYLRKKGDAAA